MGPPAAVRAELTLERCFVRRYQQRTQPQDSKCPLLVAAFEQSFTFKKKRNKLVHALDSHRSVSHVVGSALDSDVRVFPSSSSDTVNSVLLVFIFFSDVQPDAVVSRGSVRRQIVGKVPPDIVAQAFASGTERQTY